VRQPKEGAINILLASPIDSKALDVLRRDHDLLDGVGADEATLMELIHDREVLIFRSGVNIPAALMAAAPRLRLLIRAGSGLDNIDLDYLRQRGLELVRVPEPGAKAVAELAFGLMLALARQILPADRSLRQGRWIKHELTGHLLSGKQLGIVGVGTIGSLVGRMGVAWGMEAIGCVEHPSPERAAVFRSQGIRLTEFREVLEIADYLCICVPLKESTRFLIGRQELARMKPGAYIINTARGGVVEEEALSEVLRQGGLAGAALDVHQAEGDNRISPLADLPNVVLTPHIGAMTIDSQREIGRRIVEILDHFAGSDQAASRVCPESF
jgi:phosphoglycerate dehydrogenase-like enzyme